MNFEFKNEATRANLQVNKRILKWRPFWNKVYRWGAFGVVRLSFEIPPEWLEEAANTNSVLDNFQKVNLRTRRFLEKAVPQGQPIMNIANPEVIRVEETQMSEVTQSWTGRY